MRKESGKKYFSSWLVSVGYDDSSTKFPRLTDEEAQDIFGLAPSEFANSDYIEELETQTPFYSIGYAGLHMLTENFTYDFKVSFGNGLQRANYINQGESINESGTSRYIEYDLGLNYIIKQHHNIGIRIETYQHSTDIGDTTININASQIGMFYQYFI